MRTFPIEASVSCLDTPDGRTYTLIARDVSDRVRHEEELQQQAVSLAASAKELQQLNEELHRRQLDLERAMTARSRFYASMSHELRTPINAVLGYSTLLLERIYGPLNDKQAEGIERTQKAARHLLELVNDVLDLSKIEAGKIDLRLQPVEFPSLIDDLFVTVRPLADEHGSALALQQSQPRADQDHLRSAAGPSDSAQSAVERHQVRPRQADQRRLHRHRRTTACSIEVTDQGEGISDGRPGADLSRVRAARQDAAPGRHRTRSAHLPPARRIVAGIADGGVHGRQGQHLPPARCRSPRKRADCASSIRKSRAAPARRRTIRRPRSRLRCGARSPPAIGRRVVDSAARSARIATRRPDGSQPRTPIGVSAMPARIAGPGRERAVASYLGRRTCRLAS